HRRPVQRDPGLPGSRRRPRPDLRRARPRSRHARRVPPAPGRRARRAPRARPPARSPGAARGAPALGRDVASAHHRGQRARPDLAGAGRPRGLRARFPDRVDPARRRAAGAREPMSTGGIGATRAALDVVDRAPELESAVAPLRPVRLAIVGLGRMGVAHAAILSMMPEVTLVGAADSQPSAARRLHGLGFRIPVYRTLDELLARVPPDAVWVCTPPDSHLPVARHCLEAGAAGFVEKPLAHSLDDARTLAALARGAAPPGACGYALPLWPSLPAARPRLR